MTLDVFHPHSSPFGLTYFEWSIIWWKRISSLPKPENPVHDMTGKECSYKQTGPVWFLYGTFFETHHDKLVRHCTLPARQALFFPIVNSEGDSFEFSDASEAQLAEEARKHIDQVIHLECTLNGTDLGQLEQYRIRTPPFEACLALNDFPGYQTTNVKMVSDGYWVLVKPIPIGKHVIKFVSVEREESMDVTYNLTAIEGDCTNQIRNLTESFIAQLLNEKGITVNNDEVIEIKDIVLATTMNLAHKHLVSQYEMEPILDRLFNYLLSRAKRKDNYRVTPREVTLSCLEMNL